MSPGVDSSFCPQDIAVKTAKAVKIMRLAAARNNGFIFGFPALIIAKVRAISIEKNVNSLLKKLRFYYIIYE